MSSSALVASSTSTGGSPTCGRGCGTTGVKGPRYQAKLDSPAPVTNGRGAYPSSRRSKAGGGVEVVAGRGTRRGGAGGSPPRLVRAAPRDPRSTPPPSTG